MLLKNNAKLVMMGDSVTDAERARPVGEGLFNALGRGYPSLVDAMINSQYPTAKIRVINMGISGNNVRDLKDRWQIDVFDKNPDWVSILIGINDVWRQFDTPYIVENHVPPQEYKETLDHLVKITIPKTEGIILITPYYLEPNKADPMRKTMDEYGNIVKEIAEKYNTLYVDLQAAFDEHLKYYHANAIAWDRVHLNLTGHMIIAKAILSVIEY